MIDFRYHLVSLVAVFLALAVGLVLGTTALRDPVQQGLSSARLSGDAGSAGLAALQQQVRRDDGFVEQVAPQLLGGALEGQQVLIVTTADAPAELVDGLAPMLERAGATITGRLGLLPKLSAADSGPLLDDLVARALPPGLTLPPGESVDQAGAQLAAALTVAPDGTPIPPADAQAVLAAYTEAGLVQLTPPDASGPRADLVLVLTGDGDGDDATTRVLGLLAGLDDGSAGVVLAGPQGSGTGDGPLVALRKDADTADAVSGVDDVDRPVGQVATVLALAEQARGGAGQYGGSQGASGALPPARAS